MVRLDLHAGRGLVVANTHFAHRRSARDTRVWQAQRVLDCLERTACPGDAVLLAGDLNDLPDSETLRVLRSSARLPLRDCWTDHHPHDPGHTYARSNPWAAFRVSEPRRIDYVLASPNLAVTAADLVLTDPPASDHFGLRVTVDGG
jgi:endonuclease/exonuclease/phosphatase family metal-dependent hydrolase